MCKPSLTRINIQNCARCGGDHEGLEFTPFHCVGGIPAYSHFAPCPANGQPILMKVVDDSELTLENYLKAAEDVIRENGDWIRYQEKIELFKKLGSS